MSQLPPLDETHVLYYILLLMEENNTVVETSARLIHC